MVISPCSCISNGMEILYQKHRKNAKCYSVSVKKHLPSDSKKLNARLKGIVDVTRSGKGFLLHPEGDILIPHEHLRGALSGDVVLVSVSPYRRKSIGRITSILERKRNSFVGKLIRTPQGILLRPDNQRVYFDFSIVDPVGAPVGHKAIVDVVDWESSPPQAKIRSVLGLAGAHETEMRAVVASRGFDSDFPNAVLKDAQELYKRAWNEGDATTRRDFRAVTTFTIDPDTAKDFDDAISLDENPDESFDIGIHIADVTHFVKRGSILDTEAEKRGTSVYLVDRTIPMLPPALSEDLCSLKPDEDRLAFSAVFTVHGKDGGWEIRDRWFGKSIIRSQKRLTYDEADAFLKTTSLHTQVCKDVEEGDRIGKALSTLWSFASYLRKERFQNGAIMFSLDEVKPVVNSAGEVVSFKRSRYTESHQLIEELMLLANREVAGLVSKRLGRKNRLFVYRIHDVPNAEKLDELSVFLRAIGYQLSLSKQGASPKELNRILDEVKGKPEERLITTVTIRSMAKAVYATKNIGHYGLAFDDYAHFTSPIRRYPDIMVHRTLHDLLTNKKITENPETIEQRAVHSSEREVSAAQAERESVKLKQVEYFAGHIGEERDGVVSGVSDWGMYIEDKETAAEGMVRLTSLTDDTYEHHPRKFSVIGARSKKIIRVGDPMRFRVEKANIEERMLDFSLV